VWRGSHRQDRFDEENQRQHQRPGALLESIRLGTGPAAFELGEPDAVVIIATELARTLYGIDVPVEIVRSTGRDRGQSDR
jgi:hypothetical protein